MKANHSLFAAFVSLALMLGLGLPRLEVVALAAEPPDEVDYTTNMVDRADCEIQLNKVFGAIQQYRKKHNDNLPSKLSDLMPDFIHDPNILICPYVRKRGGLRTWKGNLTMLSPDAYTSYSYELPDTTLSHFHWRGVPKKTWRDLKMRQAEKLGPVVPIIRCHDHRPWINLAMAGTVYESGRYWESNFSKDEDLLTAGKLFERPDAGPTKDLAIPPRDSSMEIRQLDLTDYYNAALTNSWQGFPGNHLASLTAGFHELDGIGFDVRGVIQLQGTELAAAFPRKVSGIKVNQTCRRLHFLHAVSFQYRPGSRSGIYGIHYANKQLQEFVLLYGQHIADWWRDPNESSHLSDAGVAWAGQNEAAQAYGKSLRLYHAVWENPWPEIPIETISFDAGEKRFLCGPFVLAITVE